MAADTSIESAEGSCPYHELVGAAPRCPAVDGVPFDPFDPAQTDNPYPWMHAAQEQAPVFYFEPADVWCITRYEDILTVMRDDATFSSRNAIVPVEMTGRLREVFPDGHPIRHSLLLKDPPEHNAVRKLAQRSFTPTAVARYEPMIRTRVNALIDAFIDDGRCDLVRQFSGKLPAQVICSIIGVSDEEGRDLANWAEDTMMLFTGGPVLSDEERDRVADRSEPVMRWMRRFVEERQQNPGDDLTSELLQASREDGDSMMTTDEVIGLIDSLLIAGVGTTKIFIALAARLLLSNQDQWAAIVADRSLLDNALEECLRMRSPSRGSRRMTTREVELGGVRIPKGAHIHMMLHAAQRDPSVFEDPDELDIHRPNANKHYSFGRWTHMCLGANLARLEARISFEAFLERMPDLRLVPDQPFSWYPHMTIPQFNSRLVEWTPPSLVG
jgi:cytochrome P450